MQAAKQSRPSADDPTERTLLTGRTVLVAGGAGNVGRYIVRALLDLGATVVVPSRSAERLAALRAEAGDRGVDRLLTINGDMGNEASAAELRDELNAINRSLHAVVASLGRFVAAPSVLAAPLADLHGVLNDYLVAHFLAASTFIPMIEAGGTYTLINGPLAFESKFDGAGLVSVATAGQAMLARVLMKEAQQLPIRVNELVLYTPFGWGDKAPTEAPLAREEVGRYVAYLASAKGAAISGQTIHLNSRQPLQALEAVEKSN